MVCCWRTARRSTDMDPWLPISRIKGTWLVKDRRQITLQRGDNRLAFREVSAQLRAETALLRSVDDDAPLRVLEQNFDFDLLTPQKLLDVSLLNRLGWRQTISLEQGIASTYGWCLENQLF